MFARFLVHVGARDDPSEYAGICHLLEHLVGDNVPGLTNEQVRMMFSEWGEDPFLGELGYLGTWYGFRVPVDLLRPAIDIFGSFLAGARIERYVDEQKAIVINELRDENRLRFLRELHATGFRMQFPDHRMGRYVGELGTVESVTAIGQQQLQDFYSRYYVPANMEVVAAGGLELSILLKLLEESSFGMVRPGDRNSVLPPAAPPLPAETFFRTSLSRREWVVTPGQLEMVEFFTRGVLPGNISYEALRLFSNILDEVMFRELREKRRLTYGFLSDLRFRQEFHFLEVEGYVPPAAAQRICGLVDDCIEIAATDQDLFRKFQTGVLSAVQMHDTSVADLVEDAVHRLRIWKRISTLAENLAGYEALTLSDMGAIAGYLVPGRRWSYVIEP
ncbi:MAG: insulinase family protein [Patescibacteria group bacterium]|nr:insulinase family protein [Patescibacteria group bacterium]